MMAFRLEEEKSEDLHPLVWVLAIANLKEKLRFALRFI